MTDMTPIEKKRTALEEILRAMDSVLVAYSGGVDSSLLLWTAVKTLGPQKVIAATARAPIYIEQEESALRALPESLRVRHILVQSDQLGVEEFAANPADRCYYCKRVALGMLAEAARKEGVRWILDGSNRDDRTDYRPGARAVRELNGRSPLEEAGLTKAEIRALARQAGLANWDKPAESCLAARFPYGTRITRDGLERVRRSEDALKAMGFRIVRVRDYGSLARIEVDPKDVARLASPDTATKVIAALRAAGYQYVTADLQGYRRGSLNELLECAGGGKQDG